MSGEKVEEEEEDEWKDRAGIGGGCCVRSCE